MYSDVLSSHSLTENQLRSSSQVKYVRYKQREGHVDFWLTPLVLQWYSYSPFSSQLTFVENHNSSLPVFSEISSIHIGKGSLTNLFRGHLFNSTEGTHGIHFPHILFSRDDGGGVGNQRLTTDIGVFVHSGF